MVSKPTYEELQQEVSKLEEEILRQSVVRYRAIVENRTEMICCFLPDGTIIFVNEAYCRFFNKNRRELIGHKFLPLIPESDREEVFKNISSLNPDNPSLTHEHQVYSPTREICWHKWTNRAIYDDQNNLIEYQAVGWDITERKQAEENLQESEESFRALAENANDGILIAVGEGKHAFANRRAAEITGYSESELLKTTIKELINPYFEKMKKTDLDDQQKAYLSILKSNLNEITSPFTRKMSLKHLYLTPTEIRIANLIKHGNSTKKIAKLLKASPRTIETHRKNIRGKIGLQQKKAKLRSYLIPLH